MALYYNKNVVGLKNVVARLKVNFKVNHFL